MKYIQKKGKNHIEVEIKEKMIVYFIKDDTSSGVFDVYPESIAKNTITFTEKNDVYKMNAVYLLIIGIIFGFATILFKIPTLYIAFLIGSLVMYVLYRRSVVKYTILESSTKKLYIMHDISHDQIVKDIYALRNKLIKERFYSRMQQSEPSEINEQLQWLLDETIIDQEEFKREISKTLVELPDSKTAVH